MIINNMKIQQILIPLILLLPTARVLKKLIHYYHPIKTLNVILVITKFVVRI